MSDSPIQSIIKLFQSSWNEFRGTLNRSSNADGVASQSSMSPLVKILIASVCVIALFTYLWLRNVSTENTEAQANLDQHNKEADAWVRKNEGRPVDLDISPADHPKTAALKQVCSKMLREWNGDEEDPQLESLVNKFCAIDSGSMAASDRATIRALYYKYIGTRFRGAIFDELGDDVKLTIGK